MSTHTKRVQVGDVVEYSTRWLRSTGQYTGPEAPASWGPFARGVVEHVAAPVCDGGPSVCRVKWEDGRKSASLDVNLAVRHKGSVAG